MSLGIATIGLLATVRNGIDVILRDKNHVQGFIITDLILARVQITKSENRLELWKRLWYVLEGMPYGHFVRCWGSAGASQIYELLQVTEMTSKNIAEEFNDKYGGAESDARRHLRSEGLLDRHERTTEAKRLRTVARLMAEYDAEFGLARRVGYALFRSPTLQYHLSTLKSSIDELEDLSKSEFECRHRYAYDEKEGKRLGLQSIFEHLAGQAAATAGRLLESCAEKLLPKTMAIDFQLDLAYRSDIQLRSQILMNKATQGGYPYYVRVPNDASVEDGYLEVVLHDERNTADLTRLIDDLAADFHGCQDSASGSSPNRPTQISESLRKVLEDFPEPLEGSKQHPFRLDERYQLAYELCEIALILLSSTAMCNLCVCAVRRLAKNSPGNEHEHLIRINNAHQPEDESEAVQISRRWCRTEVLGMHILRLGIVLAEIAIGAVVNHARYDSRTKKLKLKFAASDGSATDLGELDPYQVVKLIKEPGEKDGDWANAVSYCLRRGVTPSAISGEEHEYFYYYVVAP